MVDGRTVSYASGGRGLPVLFLHGWGLDHESYRRSLRRLTARGCRVRRPVPARLRAQRRAAGAAAHAGRLRRLGRAVPRRRSAPTSRSSCSATASVAGSPPASPTTNPSGCATSCCSTRSATPGPSPPAALAGRPIASAWTACASLLELAATGGRPGDDRPDAADAAGQPAAAIRSRVLQAAQAALTPICATEMAVLAARRAPGADPVERRRPADPAGCVRHLLLGVRHRRPRGARRALLAAGQPGRLRRGARQRHPRRRARARRPCGDRRASTRCVACSATTSLPPATARRLLDGVSPLWALSEAAGGARRRPRPVPSRGSAPARCAPSPASCPTATGSG